MELNSRQIGPGHPCYIIAEAGVNHNGSLDTALELVRKAAEIGVDCIKFQTFKASEVVTKEAPKANYQLKVTDNQESQLDMLRKLELNTDDYLEIIALCKKLGVDFLSTPYSTGDAEFLNSLGVSGFKIASGQLVELDFLEYVSNFQKPVILSTGMGNLSEVFEAVVAIRSTGNPNLAVLQCTTNYPSLIEDANLKSMVAMREALETVIGYSDHTPTNYACYASVALGASVIEKHFTLSHDMEGPDHSSSLEPDQFLELIQGIRAVEQSLGSAVKSPTPRELENMTGMRRSIVLTESLPAGTVLKREHLTYKRPATGIAPKEINRVVGKVLLEDLPQETILMEQHIGPRI